MRGFKKFIGDKSFYQMVLAIAIPIMIQNGITNFVSLLDNIMIGRVGTEQMSGVSIVNQLIFVYNLCIFGGVSGAGIFTAQYFGQKNTEGIRQTVRFKLLITLLITIATIFLFFTYADELIHLYLHGKGSQESIVSTLQYGKEYLMLIIIELPAFVLVQVYASTLRECQETILPMKASIIAVVLNLILNYLLIYGKFGFPELGVSGAAIATVIARYAEAIIVVFWTHIHTEKNPFSKNLYSTIKVPWDLTKKIVLKGTPLLFNEGLWAAGMAMLVQCYSIRGLNVIAAMNISNTINNVFCIVFAALGDTVAIIIGQMLGANEMKKAKTAAFRMIVFSVLCCSEVAILMLLLAPFFPNLYHTEREIKQLATYFIIVNAIFMPQNAFLHTTYFTLRSGGKTIITFLFDSVFIWFVSVTLAYYLSHFTILSVLTIYILVQAIDLIKCIIGFILVKKGIWLQNIVS